MDDEADALSNICADLVSLRRLEPSVVKLFRDHRAGEWVPLAELYRGSGDPALAIKPELVAAWLPSADGDSNYSVIVFHDAESNWSMTATYNMACLPGSAPLQSAN